MQGGGHGEQRAAGGGRRDLERTRVAEQRVGPGASQRARRVVEWAGRRVRDGGVERDG